MVVHCPISPAVPRDQFLQSTMKTTTRELCVPKCSASGFVSCRVHCSLGKFSLQISLRKNKRDKAKHNWRTHIERTHESLGSTGLSLTSVLYSSSNERAQENQQRPVCANNSWKLGKGSWFAGIFRSTSKPSVAEVPINVLIKSYVAEGIEFMIFLHHMSAFAMKQLPRVWAVL